MSQGIVITEEHFDENVTQCRFIAYLRTHNVAVGEIVQPHEYINWSTRICDEYMKERGLNPLHPLTDGQHKEITAKYLEEAVS